MTLQEQIKEKIKEAMKAKDDLRLSVMRGVSSAITNELVSQKKTPQDSLDDEGVLTVITRLAKQRKESIKQFEEGGRPELAEDEKRELTVLEEFLPEMMSVEEIQKIAEAKKDEMGIDDPSKKGMLMGALMKDLKGRADGGDVKNVVESLFN